jgi:hypothetical protein
MRRTILLVLPILAALAGCNRFLGPIEVRHQDPTKGLAPDGKGGLTPYTLQEQEIRARERYTIPSDDRSVGPPIWRDGVSPTR